MTSLMMKMSVLIQMVVIGVFNKQMDKNIQLEQRYYVQLKEMKHSRKSTKNQGKKERRDKEQLMKNVTSCRKY